MPEIVDETIAACLFLKKHREQFLDLNADPRWLLLYNAERSLLVRMNRQIADALKS